ncbi:hypothetical protein QJQ45_025492 [Haematococcus lacustris]|nr:hypothetical protein QJQ45_025492 [Haematococcus lacustris]
MPMFDQKRDDKHWDDECLTLLCSFAPDSVMQLCTLGKKLSVKMLNEYCKAVGLSTCQSADCDCLQVIKVPGGAVLRGCKETKRKVLAQPLARYWRNHSQLRVVASLFVLRIFLTCLVGYPIPGLGLTKEAFTTEPALCKHWARWFRTGKLANKGFEFERTVEPDGVNVCVHYTCPLPTLPAPAASSSSLPSAEAAAAHVLGLPRIDKRIDEQRDFVFDPATQIGTSQLVADQLRRWKLTMGQVKQASGRNNTRRTTQRWLASIQPHLQHLAAASSAGTSLEANLKHITATLATWDAVWEVYLGPRWAWQQLRLYGAQDRALEQFFKKLEEDMAELSMERHGRAKQMVVFFGAAGIGTGGGWGADAVLRACCKVAPCSSLAATQPAASEPGPSTPPPAKRSKRTKAEQAAEPTQPTKGTGKAQGKAAKAKPALGRAVLPDPRRQELASPKHRFAQFVYTDGVTLSVMFLRPKPAAPPAELPRMGRHMGAVNPLTHLHEKWLGVHPGKTNMATVAHEERSAVGTVVSEWQRWLTAVQYYRDSGITRQAQATKTWLTQVKPQLKALSQASSKPSSLTSYRRFADTVLATYNAMWAEAKERWLDRILALAYGAAGFNGSGTIGCRGVPVNQVLKEALRQFLAGRVVMVDEFRTSRVSSANTTPSGCGH